MTVNTKLVQALASQGISLSGVDSAIPKYNTLADIPAGFSGAAQVGTQLYVGDGVGLVKMQNDIDRLINRIVTSRTTNPLSAAVASPVPTLRYAWEAGLSTIYASAANGTTLLPNYMLSGGNTTVAVLLSTYAAFVSSGASTTIEFYSDAPRIMLRTSQGNIDIQINNQSIAQAGINVAAGGGQQFTVLDWGGVRLTRKYTLVFNASVWFLGTDVDTLSRVWSSQVEHKKPIVVVGDSYTQGVGASIIATAYLTRYLKLLGSESVFSVANGGTGYINPGSADTFINKLAASGALNNNPEMIMLMGGINDATYTSAQITAAVIAILNYIRTKTACPVVVTGCMSGASFNPVNADILKCEAAISAAVTAFNDPLVLFIPVSNDVNGAWIYGTGYAGATNGSGNSDLYISSDKIHLNDAGHDYLARRLASATEIALRAI